MWTTKVTGLVQKMDKWKNKDIENEVKSTCFFSDAVVSIALLITESDLTTSRFCTTWRWSWLRRPSFRERRRANCGRRRGCSPSSSACRKNSAGTAVWTCRRRCSRWWSWPTSWPTPAGCWRTSSRSPECWPSRRCSPPWTVNRLEIQSDLWHRIVLKADVSFAQMNFNTRKKP